MARLRMGLIGGGPGSFIGPVHRLAAEMDRDFARLLRGEEGALIPGIADGLRGMALIETAVQASARDAGWVDFTV
jgi:hypothetical protein